MKYHSYVITISLIAFLSAIIGCGIHSGSVSPSDDLLYTVYPGTSAAPEMTFYWGASKETVVPPTLGEIGQYGIWEGGGNFFKTGFEPASEIEIRTSSFADPVYSCISGTVVKIGVPSANSYGQQVSYMSIRYGRKYVLKVLHLADIPASIKEGDIIEKGTLVGYTERLGPAFGFWEIELNRIDSDKVVAIPPAGFFDSASMTVLDSILVNAGETSWTLPLTAPTTEGWVSYVGTYEMWADAAKCGIRKPDGFFSLESFLELYDLSWIIAP